MLFRPDNIKRLRQYVGRVGIIPALTLGLVFTMATSSLADMLGAWRDQVTGLAIGGFDPVSYFSQTGPKPGHRVHEARWGNITWRFTSSGNQYVFARAPHVYAPRFGGYDAFAASQGIVAMGHPQIWAVFKERVYLFHSAVNKYFWSLDPDGISAQAEQNWEKLSMVLYRYGTTGDRTKAGSKQ